MLKTVSLKKIMQLPKLKMKKSERVYDKEWRTWFSCEEERQHFVNAIEDAEKSEVSYTREEVEKYFYKKYGI